MRLEYTKILDEMVINESVINQYTDGRKLLSYLHVHDVIDFQENEEIKQLGPWECTLRLIKVVLKSRKDEDMMHFLNSLQHAKYDDAYCWLKGKLDNLDSILLWKSDQIDIALKTAWDNLKLHYKVRLEFVESYWRQFGVNGILDMDTFYNHNIVITNEKKQIQKKIENFDDIFSTRFNRIIVMAEAGYGKSTFVHEMARQWVKGDKDWTRKFEFLFLFRLTEVNENESKSLENLLTICLCSHDASKIYNWLKDGNMSKVLFIFDGLDELRQNFCQETEEVIFGGKVNLATVVITSRQCKKLTDIKKDMEPKLYIELKGYTNEGVIQQLEKFSISVDRMKIDLKNHLKIPLFNTIFCITRSESSLVCTNICSSICSFVNFVINRYRKSNQSFTISCEEDLLLTLGQAAQNKFRFIGSARIPYPNVSRDHLNWAVNSGLLHNGSLIEDLVFAHQTIAEYCAAYFWCKSSHLSIKDTSLVSSVRLNEPPEAEMDYLEPFSQFVSYFCPEFKEDLWRKFFRWIPIFDEYESLPDILHGGEPLEFSSHSVDDKITIMNKIRFQENDKLKLFYGQFESEKLFKTIRKLKKLHLTGCTLNVGAEEFFIHLTNVQSLKFYECKFYNLNVVYDDPDSGESNPPYLPHLHLQKLAIRNCSVGIETFLSFIMKHSTFMNSFELRMHSFHDCGTGWISELQKNKRLCISIENCKLQFIKKLTQLEANALGNLLEVGLFGLKNINLTIKTENQEDCEHIVKNLSKLSALISLDLQIEGCGIFTTNTLNYLADIFNKLNLEQCGLEYQEIVFEKRIINSINSCLSLEEITSLTKKMKDSNVKLFQTRTKNIDKQLRVIRKLR